MSLIYAILSILIILIILFFVFSFKVRVVFNSDMPELNMRILWLYPFINAFVTLENGVSVINLYIFKYLIFKKALNIQRILNKRKSSRKGIKLMQLASPENINVNVSYGFRDPFTTGIACGAINVASQVINIDNIDSINQYPDFMSNNDYIYLNATAKINLGSALLRQIKSRSNYHGVK